MRKVTVLAGVFCFIFAILAIASFASAFWPFDLIFGKNTNSPESVKVNTISGEVVNTAYGTQTISLSACTNTKLTDAAKTYVLTKDISFSGAALRCFELGADNVVIDCQGHAITFVGAGPAKNTGYGDESEADKITRSAIYSNYQNTIIKNCVIMGNISNGAGIKIGPNANGASLINNDLNFNYAGVFLDKATQVEVSSNRLNGNLYGALFSAASSNNLSRNLIDDNSYGIFFAGASGSNTISYNTLIDNYYGIWLSENAKNNIIDNNRFDNSFEIVSEDDSVLAANSIRDNSFSGSLRFDGTRQYGFKENMAGLSVHNLSFSFWVMRPAASSNPTSNKILFDLFGNNSIIVYISPDGNYHARMTFYLGRAVSTGYGMMPVTETKEVILGKAANGRWHNIIITLTPEGKYHAYLDGAYKGTIFDGRDVTSGYGYGFVSYSLFKPDSSLFVAAGAKNQNTPSLTSYFGGYFDEMRIYNRALLTSEVVQIYRSGRIANTSLPNTNLVGWYKFDELEGNTASDSSGLGNHLSILNGPTWSFIMQSTVTPPPTDFTGGGGGGSGGRGGSYYQDIEISYEQLLAGYTVDMALGQRLRFSLFDAMRYLKVEGLDGSSATFSLSPGSMVFTLGSGESRALDINGDGNSDLTIQLEGVSNSKARVYAKLIDRNTQGGSGQTGTETNNTSITTPPVKKAVGLPTWVTILIILIVIVIIAILVILIYFKNKENQPFAPKKSKETKISSKGKISNTADDSLPDSA